MSKDEKVYNTLSPSGKARTLASLKENHQYSKPKKTLGSKHALLLDLEPLQFVLDELHVLLRIADVLIQNLIHAAPPP